MSKFGKKIIAALASSVAELKAGTDKTYMVQRKITDAEVIAAIRRNHLRANITAYELNPAVVVQWEKARVDRGGTVFGKGPYLMVPVRTKGQVGNEFCVRVYPPERLRKRLVKRMGL